MLIKDPGSSGEQGPWQTPIVVGRDPDATRISGVRPVEQTLYEHRLPSGGVEGAFNAAVVAEAVAEAMKLVKPARQGVRAGSVLLAGALVAGAGAATVVYRDQVMEFIDNHEAEIQDFRNAACRTAYRLAADAGGRVASTTGDVMVYAGCFEDGRGAAGFAVDPQIQDHLAEDYSSETFVGGEFIVDSEMPLPDLSEEVTIKLNDRTTKVGQLGSDETYKGTDAEKFLDQRPSANEFKAFWENIEVPTFEPGHPFYDQLQHNNRAEKTITPKRLMVHWTASNDNFVIDEASGMAGRRHSDACGASGCDVQFMLGQKDDENGRLFLMSPYVNSRMNHFAEGNSDTIGIEVIGKPLGADNSDPSFTIEQYKGVVNWIVGMKLLYPEIELDHEGDSGIFGHSDLTNNRFMEPGSGIVDMAIRDATLLLEEIKASVVFTFEQDRFGDPVVRRDYSDIIDGLELEEEKKDFLREAVPALQEAYDEMPEGDRANMPFILSQITIESDYGRSYLAECGDNYGGNKAGSGYSGETCDVEDDEYEGGKKIKSRFLKFPSMKENFKFILRQYNTSSHYADGVACSNAAEGFGNGIKHHIAPDCSTIVVRHEDDQATPGWQPGYATDKEYVPKVLGRLYDTGMSKLFVQDEEQPTIIKPKIVFIGDSIGADMEEYAELSKGLAEIADVTVFDAANGRPAVSADCETDIASQGCVTLPDGVRILDKYTDAVASADLIIGQLGTDDPSDVYATNMAQFVTHALILGSTDGKSPTIAMVEPFGDDINLDAASRIVTLRTTLDQVASQPVVSLMPSPPSTLSTEFKPEIVIFSANTFVAEQLIPGGMFSESDRVHPLPEGSQLLASFMIDATKELLETN